MSTLNKTDITTNIRGETWIYCFIHGMTHSDMVDLDYIMGEYDIIYISLRAGTIDNVDAQFLLSPNGIDRL